MVTIMPSRIEELLNALINGETIEFEPRSRAEAYLKNCCNACGCDGLPEPRSRMDALLYALAEKIANGGGGEAGGGDIDALIDKSITEVTSNATDIGERAFHICKALTTGKFPKATTVGEYGFNGCSTLKTIEIPNCTTLGQYAFYMCFELCAVDFPYVISVGKYAFNNCKTLTVANFPNVEAIGDNAFYNCEALTVANYPKLQSVGQATFCYCGALTIADIAANSIKSSAFYSCNKLATLILRSETLCSLAGTSALDRTPIQSGLGYIYTPSALIEDYKAATNWSTFATQFRALEDYTVDGTITGELDASKI